jgi:hypothetical protein
MQLSEHFSLNEATYSETAIRLHINGRILRRAYR